jgi:hypothetical protein
VLSAGLLVIHNTVGGGEHQLTELAGRKQVGSQLLNLVQGHVESGRDDTALVQTTEQVDDNLAASVIIDNLEVTNVSVLLHNLQKLDDNLGARTDENL